MTKNLHSETASKSVSLHEHIEKMMIRPKKYNEANQVRAIHGKEQCSTSSTMLICSNVLPKAIIKF